MTTRYDYTDRCLELADQLLTISSELRETLIDQRNEAGSGRRRLGLLSGGRSLENVETVVDFPGTSLEQKANSF